jgi:hypothetical protein
MKYLYKTFTVFLYFGMVFSVNAQDLVALQQTLNLLPAVPIAGRNLNFEFGTDTWIAKVNGNNFLQGSFTPEVTDEGFILILKQTHISIRNRWISTPGSEIILKYKIGPPANHSLLSNSEQVGTDENIRLEKTDSSRNNWISGELLYAYHFDGYNNMGVFAIGSRFGIGIRYERMLNSKLSLGTNMYYLVYDNDFFLHSSYQNHSLFDLSHHFGIDISFRLYPWGRSFFLETALGFHHDKYISTNEEGDNSFSGVVATPKFGWKIDIGSTGGFFLKSSISHPFILRIGEYGLGTRSRVHFGMGYAF